MTATNRRALTLTGLTLITAVAIATELHRHIIAFFWPLMTSFWSTYIAF
jgi:hypothetical protein